MATLIFIRALDALSLRRKIKMVRFKNGGAGGTRTPNPFRGSRFQGGVFIQPGLLHGLLHFTFFLRKFNQLTGVLYLTHKLDAKIMAKDSPFSAKVAQWINSPSHPKTNAWTRFAYPGDYFQPVK
jgi:hypothetical protein